MNIQVIESLLEAIKAIVDDSSLPRADKKKALIDACDTEDTTALGEFVSWFDGEIAP